MSECLAKNRKSGVILGDMSISCMRPREAARE